MSTTNSTQKPLLVGVFYEKVQMVDLAGLDLLGQQTPEAMDVNAQMNPALEPLRQLTTPMKFLYISSSLNVTTITPKMYVQPTYTYENAPRDLDILVLGGPNPATVEEGSLTFLREASKKTKVILTTCSGAMWLAKSGVLDGKKATTNRIMLGPASKMWPKVEWLDQRWVIEHGHFEGAQIWTAGGAGCGKSFDIDLVVITLTIAGIDMFIEFIDHAFNKKLLLQACQGLDFPYENRSQFYKGPLAPTPVIDL